jgi:hypothetical protein
MNLDDSREALAYWDARCRTLPRLAVRRRREARVMAERWHARVAEAEAARYGGGWVGVLALAVAERRVPVHARRHGLRLVRRVRRAAMVVAVGTGALVVLALVATVDLIARIV